MRIVMIVLALLGTPLASHALQPEPVETVVSGTLVKLDLESLRGLLTTDLGKPVFFDVPKAYLFENVTVGARITLQLDEQGRAVKVMDTSLPDLMVMPALLPSGVSSIQPLAASLDSTELVPAQRAIPTR
jgi:hypothetical protein